MTATLAPEIAEFAAAVRAELADLPADDVDDLTDGLEADLAERHADDPDELLGDPVAYAAELRAAAGHPPRAATSHLGVGAALPRLRSFGGRLRDAWSAAVGRHSILAGAVAMLVTLRPLWWVFRGVVVGVLVCNLFPGSFSSPFAVLAIGAAVVASVQFGRGRWLPKAWMRRALLVVNVVLAVAAPFIVAGTASTITGWSQNSSRFEEPYYPDGLMLNRVPVGNVFAYDAEGDPIESVQLFDENGRPLDFVGDSGAPWTTGNGGMVVPSMQVPGRVGWNVYPLDTLTGDLQYDDSGAVTTDPRPAPWPFPHVQPLVGDDPATLAGDDPGTLADGATGDE